MVIRVLPADARQLLAKLNAPPRLVAHLCIVHEVAADILDALQSRWTDLSIDAEAVLFGAATHDIGKVLHPNELTEPGNQHEQDGPVLLERFGVSTERSRIALTHGSWSHELNLTLEDYLVALADACWKGSRHEELESKVAGRIAANIGLEQWEAFLTLDEIISEIASRGEERLAWQGRVSNTDHE